MIKRRTGISSIRNNNSSPQNNFFIGKGRVEFVVLDNITNPQLFKNAGEWEGIGSL